MNENITSTKFIMSLLCLFIVFIAFMFDKLDKETFMPFVLGILGLYTTGNVIAKITDRNSAN